MPEIVSKEKQQEILKHIRKHGCKVFVYPEKDGLTQAHIRLCLERNLNGNALMIKASNWGEIVTTDVMDLVLKQKERQKD